MNPSGRAAVLALALLTCRSHSSAGPAWTACASSGVGAVKATFHGSAARIGWDPGEPELSPAAVARGMVSAWTSAPFDRFSAGGVDYPGRAYGSPLYADEVRVESASVGGASLSLAFVGTSNGDVYALAASDAACAEGTLPAGTAVWKTHLATPGVPPRLDSGRDTPPAWPGVAVGVLSTPVLDRAAGVLYVTAMDAGDGSAPPQWKAFALDVSTGDLRPGWPVVFARDTVEAANRNGRAYFDEDARFVSQRSALALSPAGDRLYVTFGGYWDEAVGWIVAIDTGAASIVASFSGAPDTLLSAGGQLSRHANAGMWSPAGPAVDDQGRVYVTTGNSPPEPAPSPATWGNSMLRLTPELALDATYTPFDYCALDRGDTDVAGSSPLLLPSIAGAATPNLVAFGAKSGVVYLLDVDHLPPLAPGRPPCATSWADAARDASLLPPAPAAPYCAGYPADPCAEPTRAGLCGRGPLQIFGPAGDDASVDHAKMRTTAAFFRADDGTSFLYVAGTTKAHRCTPDSVPPSFVRLRVVADAGTPAYLSIDATDDAIALSNPGSAVVTSDGGHGPVVWVVDNPLRTRPLLDPSTPPPQVWAVDGTTMKPLWRSAPSDLESGGKYATVASAHGTVYVATDRLHAFTPAPP